MGIKRKHEKKIIGWIFPTPNGNRTIKRENLTDACDGFQERFGYWPDFRNAEPIIEKESNANISKRDRA